MKRIKYGIEIDDEKTVEDECLAYGCQEKRNPFPCCFCEKHHPQHTLAALASEAAHESKE